MNESLLSVLVVLLLVVSVAALVVGVLALRRTTARRPADLAPQPGQRAGRPRGAAGRGAGAARRGRRRAAAPRGGPLRRVRRHGRPPVLVAGAARRQRQRRRAHLDPRPQRGAHLRQEHRRLDLRPGDVARGGGGRLKFAKAARRRASDGLLDGHQPAPARPVRADVEGAGGRVDRDRRQGPVPEHRVGVGVRGAGTRRPRRRGGSSPRPRPGGSAASGPRRSRPGGPGAARCWS